jgi:hypothetical protein
MYDTYPSAKMFSRHSTQSGRERFNIVPLGMVYCHIGHRFIVSVERAKDDRAYRGNVVYNRPWAGGLPLCIPVHRYILQSKSDTELYMMNQRENTKTQTIMIRYILQSKP